MKLHRFMNRPACRDRKNSSDRNREVRCALKCVVLCVETGMQPLPMRQFSEGKTDIVPKHLERANQIRPAKQQGTPASADEQPRNVHHAVQHEEVSTQPMKAKSHRQYAWPKTHVVVNPVGWT